MIRILLVALAFILLFAGYYLLKNADILFQLMKDTPANRKFFKQYGVLYMVFGMIGLLIAALNQFILPYLIIVVIIAAFFSLSFAKKMKV